MVKIPNGVPKSVVGNFYFLTEIVRRCELAVLECEDKKTKELVYVLVGVVVMPGKEEADLVPLAKMFAGDPYEEVNPPDPKNPNSFMEV